MNRFKEARLRAGLSQKYVALELGIAAPSISGWESGKSHPTSDRLARVARLYGTTPEYLLGMDDDPEPPANILPVSVITPEESELIRAYRAHPEMREAVRRLLELPAIAKSKGSAV